MSSPATSLVPITKVVKKKRPAFRPKGKSPKATSSSSSSSSTKAAATTTTTKVLPSPSKKSTTSEQKDESSSSATKATTTSTITKPTTTSLSASETSETPAITTLQSSQQPQQQSTTTTTTAPEGTSPRLGSTSRGTSSSTPSTTSSSMKRGVRKRKQIKRNGSTVSATTTSSTTSNHLQESQPQKTVNFDVPAAAVLHPSEHATAATPDATNTTAVDVAQLPLPPPLPPGLSEKDAERLQLMAKEAEKLQQLLEEDPAGPRLNSFCTKFKRPRAKKQKKETGKDHKKDEDRQTTATPDVHRNTTKNTSTVPTIGTTGGSTTATEPSGTPVVQIINGEIVLQASSLQAPGARRTVQEVDSEFVEIEEGDVQPAIVNASYNDFVDRRKPQHWSLKETKLFYVALRQLGTDFCSMEAYFENRTRKQLKRKYLIESSKNPTLMEMALNPKYQTEIDLSVFNVEVDAKAIEAAANEKPPAHEPNDIEDPKSSSKIANGGTDETKQLDDRVVVEEDADGPVMEDRFSSGRSVLPPAPPASIWPDEEDHGNDAADFAEPSMDEFFFHHQDDDPPPGEEDKLPAESDATTTEASIHENKAPSNAAATATTMLPPVPVTEPPPLQPEKVPALGISLVPTKSTQKSKRAKFRSVATRKRK